MREGGSIPVSTTFQKTHGLPMIFMGFGLHDDPWVEAGRVQGVAGVGGRHPEHARDLRRRLAGADLQGDG